MANVFDNEVLFESIVVAGQASPGVVTVEFERAIGWDVKKGKGQKGATITRTGEGPAEITCTFLLVRDDAEGVDDVAEWPEFEALLRSSISGATPKPLDFYYPDTIEQDITSIVLKSIGSPKRDGKGGETRVVKLLEYRPPEDQGGTAAGSRAKPAPKKPSAPDPDAERLAELARLTDVYNRTPWG